MRRLLWLLVCLAVAVSGITAVQRIQMERQQRVVELVYDYRGLEHLASYTGLDMVDILKELREQGVTTIAVPAYSLLELALAGELVPDEIGQYLESHAHELDNLWDQPTIYPKDAFAVVETAGMKAAPRLSNPPWGLSDEWLDHSPNFVILGGVESPGFPYHVRDYAQLLADLDAKIGVVEFAQQKGFPGLAPPERMVRVHGINQREMEALSSERITARYLRAAKERNIRVLYLHPILTGEDPWQATLQILTDLTSGLRSAGFTLGESRPFPAWQVPSWQRTIVWIGIWAGAALLTSAWVKLPAVMYALGAALGLLFSITLSSVNLTLAQQGMALLAAVVFPCLAFQVQAGRSTISRFASISAVSIAGGFLVAGCLTGTEYLIKVAEFRGVKLMHILPIGIMALAVVFQPILPIKSRRELGSQLSFLWNLSIPLKLLVVGGTCLAGAGAVYILRTGNFGLPVANMEIVLREFLEKVLVVRPRTKEFLIGHPALYILLRERRGKAAWLMPVAVIGQLSMVNTFSHIHTPLLVTLIRTGYGLVFGYIIGWTVYQLYQLGKGLFTGDRGLGVSRLWQSGR